MALLGQLPALPFDVVVLSIGANDATGLCAPYKWAQWQQQLLLVIEERFAPGLLVHTAVPPMHACKALPQPLRWFMGIWANEMNRLLAAILGGIPRSALLRHPASTTSTGMAMDGIHPSASGYRLWAEGLCHCILAHHAH